MEANRTKSEKSDESMESNIDVSPDSTTTLKKRLDSAPASVKNMAKNTAAEKCPKKLAIYKLEMDLDEFGASNWETLYPV